MSKYLLTTPTLNKLDHLSRVFYQRWCSCNIWRDRCAEVRQPSVGVWNSYVWSCVCFSLHFTESKNHPLSKCKFFLATNAGTDTLMMFWLNWVWTADARAEASLEKATHYYLLITSTFTGTKPCHCSDWRNRWESEERGLWELEQIYEKSIAMSHLGVNPEWLLWGGGDPSVSALIGLIRKSMQLSHPPKKGSGVEVTLLVPQNHENSYFFSSSGWYLWQEGGVSWLKRS